MKCGKPINIVKSVAASCAKNNLEETFDVLETIYNITDLENGIISKFNLK